jgi:hypothetical protein
VAMRKISAAVMVKVRKDRCDIRSLRLSDFVVLRRRTTAPPKD